MSNEITGGSLFRSMVRFSVPYLIACFLQTFYGLADLAVTGRFNGAASVSAVAIGSQVMHMLTVIIVGLAMGSTVTISRSVGAGSRRETENYIGNSITIFAVFAVILTGILLLFVNGILSLLSTPPEAMAQARAYLIICFAGIPFVTAYNILSSIFRGLGDTRRPMIFVAIAGIINIGLDFLLVGGFRMGAAGAAAATTISQALSVLLAILSLRYFRPELPEDKEESTDRTPGGKNSSDALLRPGALKIRSLQARQILTIGIPIACQDGLIQVSFLVITAIANSRGVDVAAAVGIVEKIISFLFLVPSAMLSTVSAIAAQNIGAGNHDRSHKTLHYGTTICVLFGLAVFVICQFASGRMVGLFVKDEPEVRRFGAQYLRSYSLDCIFAGIHFCYSGFFSAYGKSMYSFLHNIISITVMRIPGAYLASVLFPATLYPMGLAAPLGSLLSALICIYIYRTRKKDTFGAAR